MAQDEPKLAEIRQQIDALDQQIHKLLNQRAECAMAVAEVKQAAVSSVDEQPVFYRPEREAQVLRKVIERNQGPLEGKQVAHIFREVMSACLALEKPLEVAFLGPKGTFTQAAAIKQFGHAAITKPYATVDRIFRAVESGECNYGVVPVENSTEGVVNHTFDCLASSSLNICGELEIPIALHLLVGVQASIESVTKICAHQQALAQSRDWLDSHYPKIERVAVSSNGEAAELAAKDSSVAAIAGDIALNAYDVVPVAKNIEDCHDNTTRFLVIAPQQILPSGDDKTCLMVSARNEPGALYNLLQPFNKAGINLTRLTSRPSRTETWAYVFFIEFEGHESDVQINTIISQLEAKSYSIKSLGSFPKAVL